MWKCGLRSVQEELILSPEFAKDCEHFNFFFALFSKSIFVGHIGHMFLQIRDHMFTPVLPNCLVLFSTVNSKMSRNMCKLRLKVRIGHFYPHWSPNFKHFQLGFSNKILLYILGFQKHIASIRLSKCTKALNFFESFRQETKISFLTPVLNY